MRIARYGSALALAVLVLAAWAPPALAAKAAILTGYDVLALPGGPATLRFKVERDNLLRYDLHGVRVEFRYQGLSALLGVAASADDGYADLRLQVPRVPGDYYVEGRIAPGQRYFAPAQTLLLAVREPTARLVITDIDHTIADVEWYDFLWKSTPQVRPVRGAVQALRDISADATIVYLTARDDGAALKTKGWLRYWGFPRGPVFFSDHLIPMLDPEPYKTDKIRSIKGFLPNIPCGFGDLSTDARAYQANGLRAFIFDTHNAGPFPPGSIVERDWDELRAARRPELAWASRFR